MNTSVQSRNSGRAATRGGVILLIMLGMLALFTLIAATFVISAGHFRRGAMSASRAEQMGDSFEVLLQQALMQVVRGSNNPQSVIGPHSLLEDLYGDADSMAGMVVETTMNGLDLSTVNGPAVTGSAQLGTQASFYPTSVSRIPFSTPNSRPQDFSPMLLEFSAVGFGWDKEPGVALVDDDNNGIVDDVFESFAGDDAMLGSTYAHPVACGVAPGSASASVWQSKMLPANGLADPAKPLPIIDNVDNYYAGRAITFLSGEAAGKSSHIVRSKAVPVSADTGACVTMLWVQPLFGDVRPTTRDRFIINGRPFNGTGLGYSPYVNNLTSMSPKTRLPDLRRLDMLYVNPVSENASKDRLVGVPIALLPNPTDAGYREYLQAAAPIVDPDEDYDAADVQNMLLAYRMWNGNRGRYETVMPSLHRPDLVNYFVRNFGLTNWTQLPPHVRRRIILRPETADHYDYTQENKLDPELVDGWNPAESFTDTNRNSQWDPGEPYQDANNNNSYDTGDRTFAANAFDAVNGPWDVDNDGDGDTDSIWVDLGMPVTTLADGRAVKPLFAILCTDLDGRLNMNAHGSHGHYTRAADINDPSFNPLGPTPRGSTDERLLLGAGGYLQVQENTNGQYSFTARATKYPLDGAQMGMFNIGDGTEDAYATRYLFDEPARKTDSSQLFEPGVGHGMSVADINLGAWFVRDEHDFPCLQMGRNNNLLVHNRNFRYRWLLEGTYYTNVASNFSLTTAAMLANALPLLGRYGEAHVMRGLANPPHYPGTGITPRAGVSDGAFAMGVLVPHARMLDPADDDWAGSPAPVRNGGGPPDTNDRTNMVVRGNSTYDAFVRPDNRLNINSGVYGTPGDPLGAGFIGLDIAGRPIYKNMAFAGETRDEPWEINLVRRYSPRARSTTSVGDIDSNFTPGELARILRDSDPDSNIYEKRLYDHIVRDSHDNNPRNNATPHAVTTEQWDIPCPHIAPTPEMSGALRALGLPINNPALGDLLRARFYIAFGSDPGRLNAANASRLATISMRSYRTHLNEDFIDADNIGVIPWGWIPHFSPSASMGGARHAPNPKRGSARLTTLGLKRRNTRLISPDLVVGLRMNVNAPLGNGFDDDGDLVVDEWTESIEVKELAQAVSNFSTPGQPLWSGKFDGPPAVALSTQYTVFANGGLRPDTNRDGNYDNRIDEMGHQQQAKELYCLMMLLLDQNYVIPALEMTTVASATGAITVGAEETPPAITATFPSNLPQNSRMRTAKGWLTARQVAQWAINAVDFRDRDTIMTPFEFDVDPFYDNDGDCTPTSLVVERPTCNGTWDVDGLVADDPSISDASQRDSARPWRGIVWGCEYPDLILTETLAFHDRRTANMEQETSPPMTYTSGFTMANFAGNVLVTPTGELPYDPHWDQGRMPQGSLFVELYATGNPHLTLSTTDLVESGSPRELYTVDGRLNISKTVAGFRWRTSTTPEAVCNPVWRLAITQAAPVGVSSHPNNVARRAARHPSTCSFHPFETYGAITGTGSPLSTLANFSLLPPSLVGNSGNDLQAVTCNRFVAFTSVTVAASLPVIPASTPNQLLPPRTLVVNATPESMFSDTSDPNYTQPDVYRIFDRSGPSPANPAPLLAYPGDYVVVGPHRQAETSTASTTAMPLDNITFIGSTLKTLSNGTYVMASLTSGTAVPTLSYLQNLTQSTKAESTPYNYPPPIIDLGMNASLSVASNSAPSVSLTGRPFVVTNLSGLNEHPVGAAYPVSAYVAVKQTSLLSTTLLASQAIISSTLIRHPSGTLGTIADFPTWPQVRRTIVAPCAITDTNSTQIANFGRPIGLNISEPQVLRPNTGTGSFVGNGNRHGQQYRNPGSTQTTTTNPFETRLRTLDAWATACDTPFDGYGSLTGTDYRLPDPDTLNPEFAAMGINRLSDETYLNVKTVFLQRLADPTRIWDADTNPYLTLDWMPIDLTVFNGESMRYEAENDKSKAFHLMDPDNPPTRPVGTGSAVVDSTSFGSRIRFGSRQRGSPSRPFKGRFSGFDLWSQPNWLDTDATAMSDWYAAPPPTKKSMLDPSNVTQSRAKYGLTYGVVWQHPLQHTLGYLNVGYHVYRTNPSLTSKPTLTNAVYNPFVRPLGSRPNPQQIGGSQSFDQGWYTGWDLCQNRGSSDLALYIGSPRRPFNWLAWNNRPYHSALELMMVPCSGPSRLLHDYDMRRTAVGPINSTPVPNPPASPQFFPDERRRSANEYLPYLTGGGTNKFGYTQAPPYRYLLNFFTSSVAAPALTTTNNTINPGILSNVQPNFYRVFEFLTVPSKFAGTQQMHLHGRYTTSGGHLGIWNNGIRMFNPTNPDNDFLIAVTPPGSANPGTPSLPVTALEHPGWPFTAPNNYISIYREPGRVNVNTIPVLSASLTLTNVPRVLDKQNDMGATIWRGVTNEFFPALHPVGQPYAVTGKHQFGGNQFWRGWDAVDSASQLFTAGVSNDWENPSDDYIDNFFGMISGMRSDWPEFDLRGPNAAWQSGGGDDRLQFLNDSRQPAPSNRRDFSSGASTRGRMDPQKPAWIANPIRSFNEDFSATPPAATALPSPYGGVRVQNHESAYRGIPYLAVDSTLLRRKDTTWSPWQVGGTTSEGLPVWNPVPHNPQTALHLDPAFDPLFALNFPRPNSPGISGYTVPMYDPTGTDLLANQRMKISDYRNTDRNPFFRYQLYTKLGSTVTTKSNVYAIWITIGMFECERVGRNILPSQNGFASSDDFAMPQRFPDGFRILREVGSDTGETRRHKLFAIFDRSIPVGFKRGENYNVDQAFLLRHIVN